MADQEWQDVDLVVDLADLLPLIARSLYPRPDAAVRELLANAVDALTKKEDLARAQGGRTTGPSEVTIAVDATSGVLTVRDTGCGMTWEEVVEFINHIGKSGTKLHREQLQDRNLIKALIGEFGIGLLAAFKLGRQVNIRTRSLDAGEDEGVEWQASERGLKARMRYIHKAETGTEVIVVVDPENRKMLSSDRLNQCVSEYGDLLPYPIYNAFHELQNSYGQVPWRSEAATDPGELKRYIVRRHRGEPINPPLYVIPIEPQTVTVGEVEREVDCHGVLYIPSDTAFLNPHAAVDLYSHSMLVRKDRQGVLPEHIMFVHGIVDCSDLSMVMNREDVLEDSNFEALQAAIAQQLYAGLRELVQREADWKLVQSTFDREVKLAVLKDREVFAAVGDALSFFVGHGQRQSLREYTEAAAQRRIYDEARGTLIADTDDLLVSQGKELEELRRTLIFITSYSGPARYQLDQLLYARGLRAIEVVPGWATDQDTGATRSDLRNSLDYQVLREYAEARGLVLKSAETLVQRFPTKDDPHFERVAEYFRATVPRGLVVRVSAFKPEALPVLLDFPGVEAAATTQVKDWQKAFAEFFMSGQDRAPEGLSRMLEWAEKGAQLEDENRVKVIINAENATIKYLADALESEEFRELAQRDGLVHQIAIELYHVALQYTGYQPSDSSMSVILQARQEMMDRAIQYGLIVAGSRGGARTSPPPAGLPGE